MDARDDARAPRRRRAHGVRPRRVARPGGGRARRRAHRRAAAGGAARDGRAHAAARRGSLAVLRARRRRPRPRLGDGGRGPDAAQPDGLRGRRQDRLHDELLVGADDEDGDGARRAPRRALTGRAPGLPHAGGDGRGGRVLLPGGRALRLPGAVPAGARRVGRLGRGRPRGARRSGAPRRRGGGPPARAPGHRPVRRGARDADEPRPLLAARARLVDAPDVRAARRPRDEGRDDRAPLPPLPRMGGPRLLAHADARAGSPRRRDPVPDQGPIPLGPWPGRGAQAVAPAGSTAWRTAASSSGSDAGNGTIATSPSSCS